MQKQPPEVSIKKVLKLRKIHKKTSVPEFKVAGQRHIFTCQNLSWVFYINILTCVGMM